jgi:phenylpropionate dioxygenase-like ring-hydroxylating dioxygenase large terminal subunit
VRYRYTAPFAAWLRIDYEEAGGCNVITFFVQPVDAERCAIHVSVHRDDLDGDLDRLAAALAFEHAVTAEDLVVQEAFVHRSLPLDLTVEVHTRADRMTVELRRILGDLVAAAALTVPPVVGPAAEGAADTGTSPAERSSDATATGPLEPVGGPTD